MKPFLGVTFVFLGIGQNLPFESLYFYGLGPADLLFVVLSILLLLSRSWRQAMVSDAATMRLPICAGLAMSVLALLSMAFNAPIYGVEGRDIFEIGKYVYLLTLMVVSSSSCRKAGVLPIAGFAVGVILTGVTAFLNPKNPDVVGTPMIFNPNVIGNALAVAALYSSLIILDGRPLTGAVLAICSVTIAFFTFSKGTWLMTAFALIACFTALQSSNLDRTTTGLKASIYLTYVLFGGLLYIAYAFHDTIISVVGAKLVATQFGTSAEEGGSVSARVGLMVSAIHMFLLNPLLGVGISNFEAVNRMYRLDLGEFYYDDDNPNSVWFYILGCMGLPALICFLVIFVWFLKRVQFLAAARGAVSPLYIVCVGAVFFIGGSVQLQMLTAYYYWIGLGFVSALCASKPQVCVLSQQRP